MKNSLVFIFGVLLLLGGCVKAVSTTVGAAAGATKTAAKTTVGVSGDMVEAAFEPRHRDNDPRPFDDSRNAMADVNAALAAAKASGKNVLLVLGGNWCHDSRGLAAKFEQDDLAAVIAENYELVWVDVGYRDRNLEVPRRFGVPELYGTPTVLILSPYGDLLNRDSVHEWRTADSKPYEETLSYFQTHAPGQ
ncbi:thioredoxin family protein [Hyphococcus sp.]|uniref:thioredoxin family protein n=1 Tax=Hyphococcus sp. TaxID=2038636 RepID=UPI0035C6CD63